MAAGQKAFDGTIVAYQPLHLADIQALWVRAWTLTMPDIDFAARAPWLATHLDQLQAAGHRIRVGLARNGAPAGFVTVEPTSGHLDQICVAAQWFGSGLANALLNEARTFSPDRLYLDVNAQNPRAIAFYAREGFIEAGRGVNTGSGLPIVRMVWKKR